MKSRLPIHSTLKGEHTIDRKDSTSGSAQRPERRGIQLHHPAEEKNDALVLSLDNVYREQNAGDPMGRDQVPIKYGKTGRYPDICRSSAIFPTLISGSGHSEYNSSSIPPVWCRPPRNILFQVPSSLIVLCYPDSLFRPGRPPLASGQNHSQKVCPEQPGTSQIHSLRTPLPSLL